MSATPCPTARFPTSAERSEARTAAPKQIQVHNRGFHRFYPNSVHRIAASHCLKLPSGPVLRRHWLKLHWLHGSHCCSASRLTGRRRVSNELPISLPYCRSIFLHSRCEISVFFVARLVRPQVRRCRGPQTQFPNDPKEGW